jgi:hypothetical protein
MATIRPRAKEPPFEIHHDAIGRDEEDEDDDAETVDESRAEEDENQEGYSEDSEESDDFVDPLVQEDMEQFVKTFSGIKERFRLINRIGEGRSQVLGKRLSTDAMQVPSPQFTRRKIYYTKPMTTLGISRERKTPRGSHLSTRSAGSIDPNTSPSKRSMLPAVLPAY